MDLRELVVLLQSGEVVGLAVANHVLVGEGVVHVEPVVEVSEPEDDVVAEERNGAVLDLEEHVSQDLLVLGVPLLSLSRVCREVRIDEAESAVMNLESDT